MRLRQLKLGERELALEVRRGGRARGWSLRADRQAARAKHIIDGRTADGHRRGAPAAALALAAVPREADLRALLVRGAPTSAAFPSAVL